MIRVATWNIQFGRRLPTILDAVARLPRVDAIALQELSEHAGEPDAARIARRLGPAWRSRQVTAQLVSGRQQANGFVWNADRLDVLSVDAIDLPVPSGRALRRLPPSRRNAAVMEARVHHRPIRLYSVHLDVFGIAHKYAQLAHVLADAARRPPVDLTLISGDMNTYGVAGRPRWTELRRLAQQAGFEELTVGIGWTHQRLGLRQKLDAIFVSPRGLPYRRQRIILPGSDHIPVWVELRALGSDPPGTPAQAG
jgi:endonuclease/exonuclease/phosphatase family metal-dependent hydrolase